MIFIPFTGPLTRLTVRGWWDVETPEATRIRFTSLLKEHGALRAELAMREADLANREEQLNRIRASRPWKVAEKIHSIWRLMRRGRAA